MDPSTWIVTPQGIVQIVAGLGVLLFGGNVVTGGKLWGSVKRLWVSRPAPGALTIEEAYSAFETVEDWGQERNAQYKQGCDLIRDNWLSDDGPPPESDS